MASLPTPSADALLHSHRLREMIAAEIAAQGWITFARYMELALYAPGLGYYSAGAQKFGVAGDFVTAPEISVLFGRTLARQIAEILPAAGNNILEIGAGSGKLAVDVLTELESLNALPDEYYILELSADLRARQHVAIAARLPHYLSRVRWLDALPAGFSGVIVANEVLDALPVNMLRWTEDGPLERGVRCDAALNFHWCDNAIGPGPLAAAVQRLKVRPPYVSEISLAAEGFVASLSEAMTRGVMLFIDYGFAGHEFYHPQRNTGTLMCHYRHHAHADPFYLPGLQDITAHVDFSAVARCAANCGLRVAGYASQAQFLINCGITTLLAETPADDVATYLPHVAAVQKLLSPAEMGELFKVMALEKNGNFDLNGFRQGNKLHALEVLWPD